MDEEEEEMDDEYMERAPPTNLRLNRNYDIEDEIDFDEIRR